MPALLRHTKKFILLNDGEIASITANSVSIVNKNLEPLEKETFTAEWDEVSAEKGGFPHFMLKEIHEQPKALSDTILPRIKNGEVDLSETSITPDIARSIK
jgi:glucosamine--fructose-6-phosphate aminotransferase (isomerizing)